MPEIRVIDEDAVSLLLTVESSIERLREVYEHARAGAAKSSDRETLPFGAGWIRTMAAYDLTLGLGVVKAFNRSAVTAQVRYGLHLYRLDDGELLALIDGREITDLRTGGMGGLVAGGLAGGQPVEVGIIGSGNQARAQLAAIDAVCDIRAVSVFSPTEAHRETFAADRSAALGVPVTAVGSASEAVGSVDIAVLATSSKDSEPIIRAEWLPERVLVLAVGSTRPTSAEVDTATIASARLVLVDTIHACEEAGELVDAIHQGATSRDAVQSLESSPVPPAETWDSGRIVFKSVGGAVQDLALASLCHERALDSGDGRVWSTYLSARRPSGATTTTSST